MTTVETPLHPAIVHIPIGIGIALPFVAGLVLYLMVSQRLSPRVWLVVVLLQVMIAGGAIFASRTGEAEEERVEEVLDEELIEEHEEAAEVFVYLSLAGVLLSIAGLLESKIGSYARPAMIVLSVVAIGAGMNAGKKGGELVYVHNAGKAYLKNPDGADGCGVQ